MPSRYKLVSIRKAPRGSPKKQVATFKERSSGRISTTSFGAAGMSDYTKHKDAARKARYIKRHSRREHWGDPRSAGALSRQVLWNKPSQKASVADQKRRFGLAGGNTQVSASLFE